MINARIAQLDRASDFGSEGRGSNPSAWLNPYEGFFYRGNYGNLYKCRDNSIKKKKQWDALIDKF